MRPRLAKISTKALHTNQMPTPIANNNILVIENNSVIGSSISLWGVQFPVYTRFDSLFDTLETFDDISEALDDLEGVVYQCGEPE
jgi:hypothetical protein